MFALAFNASGRKSVLTADFLTASKSCPQSVNSFFATSSDPGARRDGVHVLVRVIELEVFFAPTRSYHLPWISGRFGFVDDDRRRRAFLRCDFVFIRPSAVVGHGPSFEHLVVEL